jgi:arylsulfatase A-like enzyme
MSTQTPAGKTDRPSYLRLFLINSAVMGALYIASTFAFALTTEDVDARFAGLARGPYLWTAVWTQVRMLPAYIALAAAAALLMHPFIRSKSRRRLLLQVIGADVLLMLIALGPALLVSPGLFDLVARKLPTIDLYALQRIYLFHAETALLVALGINSFLYEVRNRRARLLALVFAIAAGVFAWREPPWPHAVPLSRPNVLIIATDSWRYDRVGIHGSSHPDLTPNIDAFAKTAVDFTNLHVSTASTLESWATIFTGLFPPSHGIRSMYPSREEVAALEAREQLLPKLLTGLGFDTFVSSDWAGNCFDLVDMGFAERHVGSVQNFSSLLLEATMRAHPLVPLFFQGLPGILGDVLVPGRASLAAAARPSALTDHLFEDIDTAVLAGHPFFGLIFLSPTHLPYSARSPFNTKYSDPGYDGPNRYQVEVRAHELITTGFNPTLSKEAIRHVRDLYDGAVSDFDDTVGHIMAALDARNLSSDTIVIVTTDHGEDLYDPGSTLGHGTNFFGGDQSTHIPFFIRVPKIKPGRVEALTRSVDIAPTLLSLLKIKTSAKMQGVDLTPLLKGQSLRRNLTAFAETCYLFFPKSKAMTVLTDAERAELLEVGGAADTLTVDPNFRDNLVLRPDLRSAIIATKDRMVRTERWKLIEIPGKTKSIRRLYDMLHDPNQRINLAGQGLPVEEALSAMLGHYEPKQSEALTSSPTCDSEKGRNESTPYRYSADLPSSEMTPISRPEE